VSAFARLANRKLGGVEHRNTNMPVTAVRRIDGMGLSVVTLFVAFAATATWTMAQSTVAGMGRLPAPTGRFGVGRATVRWTDESRVEPLSPKSDPRELMVDIWYPAESTRAPPAEYLDVVGFERALGADGLRKRLRGAYEAIAMGTARTHALSGAPFAHSIKRSPVLIFSPGWWNGQETLRGPIGRPRQPRLCRCRHLSLLRCVCSDLSEWDRHSLRQ